MCSASWEYLGVQGYVHNLHLTYITRLMSPELQHQGVRWSVRLWCTRGGHVLQKALERHGIELLPLLEKENLGIMNGTAFSASVASLALYDAVHLALLAQASIAMGTEALLSVRANYGLFIHEVAQPHPGQVRPHNSEIPVPV